MAIKKVTSKEYFRTLTIIYAGLVMGQLGIGAGFYFSKTVAGSMVNDANAQNILKYLVPVIIIAAYFGASRIYTIMVSKLSECATLEEKMTRYRTPFIVRLALLEAAYIFTIVIYANTLTMSYLYFALLPLGYSLILFPTRSAVGRDIGLDFEDQNRLMKDDEVISEYSTKG